MSRDHAVSNVGVDRGDPVGVGIGERPLRAGMRTLGPQDHRGPLRPRRQIKHASDVGNPGTIPNPAIGDSTADSQQCSGT
ncbi:MAG: hypothetical protein ACRDQ5_00675 [Sciscionella sp.]